MEIEALILWLEETHWRDFQEVRKDVTALTDRVTTGEVFLSVLTNRVTALEQAQDSHRNMTIALQLHMEEVEDQSRRNNLPEATGAENLAETVIAIF